MDKMYPVQLPIRLMVLPTNKPTTHPIPRPRQRLKVLIGLGSAQLVFGVMSLCWSCWLISLNIIFIYDYMTLTSSIYHIFVSIVTIIGGSDACKFRCCVVTCMVMAIIGAVTFKIKVILVSALVWPYVGAVFAFIVMVLDIVISSVACCNICSCCGCCYVDMTIPLYISQLPQNLNVHPDAHMTRECESPSDPLSTYDSVPLQETREQMFITYPPVYNPVA